MLARHWNLVLVIHAIFTAAAPASLPHRSTRIDAYCSLFISHCAQCVLSREQGLAESAQVTVDSFAQREREQFFASKGIADDVDSFDWSSLRKVSAKITLEATCLISSKPFITCDSNA